MKKFNLLFLIFLMALVSSCVGQKELSNDENTPATITATLDAMKTATGNTTPEALKKGEYVEFHFVARLYTGDYQPVGYETFQVLDRQPGTITLQDGTKVDVINFSILDTTYKEPAKPGDQPPVDVQKELDCQYAPQPYNLWVSDCELAPYQNYFLFSGIEDHGESVFFNLKAYQQIDKLPQSMIDENRCYGFKDCELNMNYLEFDAYQKADDGSEQRVHLTNSFSSQLPYLASNPLQCLDTLITVEGQQHPYQVCRLLVNFQPGTE